MLHNNHITNGNISTYVDIYISQHRDLIMPLPKPKKDEDRDTFLSRAINSPSIKNEFQTNEHRLIVCNALWEASEKEEGMSMPFVEIKKTEVLNKIVKGIVYTAGHVDTDGETMTIEDVQKAAWDFLALRKEKNIDSQHDWQQSGCYIVDSYMTEVNDPNFPEHSWVIAVKCTDEIFDKVVSGELNGFSFGGYTNKYTQRVLLEVAKQIVGETEENLNTEIIPAHSHNFIILYNKDGKIEKGLTDTIQDHFHTISYGTATDVSVAHSHRMEINE